MFRRKFIKTAGGTAVAGLIAGCNGGGEGTATEGTTQTTSGGTTETAQATETETAQETTTGGGQSLQPTIGNVPQGLKVSNVKVQKTDGNDAGAVVTGTIRGTGSQTYEQLEVQATLLDQTDDVLGEWFDNTEGENIQTFGQGDRWQFRIDLPSADLGNAAAVRIDVDNNIDQSVWSPDGNETASADLGLEENLGDIPQGLKVVNTNLTRLDGNDAGARLTGTIRNTGGQTYEQLEVQATLLDQSDDVLGAWFDNTEGENIQTFGQGNTWQFSIDFPSADLGNAAAYRIDVDNTIDNSVWDWGGGNNNA